MRDDRTIITCAVTGGMTVPTQSEAIPVTPREIVEAGIGAHTAGAAIIHIHVREPQTGKPSADLRLFIDVLQGIREHSDAVLQPTTGGGVGMTLEERVRVVRELQPEMATFNAGSINFGLYPVLGRDLPFAQWEREYLESTRDYVFRNSFADLERVAAVMREANTKPEIEVYDVGHLFNLRHLVDRELVDVPLQVQFVLGVLGGNAAQIDQLLHMVRTAERLFGNDFTWGAAGVGYPGEFEIAANTLTLGGHVRVGLEDNLRVRRTDRATSNADLVDKATRLLALFDRVPATPAEARKHLGLKGAAAVGF